MASGVSYFNQTEPAMALARAWAEAMAHVFNSKAPDDQAYKRRPSP